MNYSLLVEATLFQPFYIERVENHYQAMQMTKSLTDIAITNFWHGIADFYGRMHWAGVKNKSYDKLQVGDSYEHFITEFFPVEWKCKAHLLYKIFRCGMVHQISPKYAGIAYLESPQNELIYPMPDPNNGSNPDIPLLNSRVYGELVYAGFKEFRQRLNKNSEPIIAENIHNNVTGVTDGIGDIAELQKARKALGTNPFGRCV
jgi:hypothetical protein